MARLHSPHLHSTHSDGLVGFSVPAHGGRYHPADHRYDRVSLALWRGAAALDPSPVFSQIAGGMATAVVLWPVGADGYLGDAALGLAQVCEWHVPTALFEQLASQHQRFHLGRHDVWIRGSHRSELVPCPESLHRLVEEHQPDLAHRLAREVERIRTRLTSEGS